MARKPSAGTRSRRTKKESAAEEKPKRTRSRTRKPAAKETAAAEAAKPAAETAAAEAQGAVGEAATRFPLFYNAPRPVEATRHAGWAIAEDADLGFAASANAVPLNVVEFAVAARHYPIVFSNAAPHLPVAVCGLQTGANAFVDADNRWAPGCYVPAYIRRYPFILMENAEAKQFILCVDEEADMVAKEGERTLFDDEGKPTEFTNRAMEFCRAYHGQYETTRRFVEELAERDLLADNSSEIRLSDDRSVKMEGYKVIDREKFDALPDDVFLDWRRKNWLPVVYSHMVSLTNWPSVLQRAADRTGAS